MTRTMKDSGIEWIGQIPEDWSISKVKHCFTRKNSKAKQDDPVVLSLARSGVKIRDISTNEGQLAESYYDYNPVRVGDLLLNPMDLYSGANCSYSDVEGVISPAYINLKNKEGVSNSKFYDYYFKVQYWMMVLFSFGKGVSFDNRWTLGQETLMNFPIVYPLLSEQQKIADFLDKKCSHIDSILEKTKASIDECKQLKQSVITQAVTKGIRPNRPMKDSGIEWIAQIPEDWKISKVKREFSYGSGLPITKENLIENGVPVISYGQIHAKFNTGVELDEKLYRYVSEDYLETNSNSLVNKYDFIFADTSEDLEGCGNCAYISEQMTLFAGYHTIVLHSKKAQDNRYIAYLFKSPMWRNQITSRVTGIKVFSISKKILNACTLLIPSFAEQIEIANYLDLKCSEIDKLIAKKEQLIEELETYKKSLIYEYVTGKKEVI